MEKWSHHFCGKILFSIVCRCRFQGEGQGQFEDIDEVIRTRKSKKNYNDLQNTEQEAEDWATRNPLKLGENAGAPEG